MSVPMKLAVRALHLRPKPLASVEATIADVAEHHTNAAVPHALTRTHHLETTTHDGPDGGLEVITLTPREQPPSVELLYTHGGAYIHPLVGPHWAIIEHLVSCTPAARITVPLYGLAPAHTAAQVLPQIHALYDRITTSGLPVVLAGDSAGGAITLTTTVRARDEHLVRPAAVLLFSPWVEATMTNPAIADIEPHDPMLGPAGLRWCAERWAVNTRLDDPRISPLNDHLSDLPPISVYQGGLDVFAPDVAAFARKAAEAGTHVQLHSYPDAFHVFVGVPAFPESTEALNDAADIVASCARG